MMLQRATDVATFLQSRPTEKIKTGCSPHTIIHRQNKAAVRYFALPAGVEARRPVFISMPLINTWTIFDLLPGKSVVEALTKAGVPVYLLDWGTPADEDAAQTLADTIDSILVRAIDRSMRHARAAGLLAADDRFDMIGYCVGGTFLSIALARNPGLARSLCLLAAPIDFHKSGRLAVWAHPDNFPVDEIVDGLGNFPAELMRESFAWLRPMGQSRKWKSLWDRVESRSFLDTWSAMEKWSGDNVDFPGESYREYIHRCYFDNALIKGGWQLAGRPVNLGANTIPALAIAADQDHICPPAAAFGLKEAWGGPVETQVIAGGHVGVCIGKALPAALLAWLAR